jgi:hypothetical protein
LLRHSPYEVSARRPAGGSSSYTSTVRWRASRRHFNLLEHSDTADSTLKSLRRPACRPCDPIPGAPYCERLSKSLVTTCQTFAALRFWFAGPSPSGLCPSQAGPVFRGVSAPSPATCSGVRNYPRKHLISSQFPGGSPVESTYRPGSAFSVAGLGVSLVPASLQMLKRLASHIDARNQPARRWRLSLHGTANVWLSHSLIVRKH